MRQNVLLIKNFYLICNMTYVVVTGGLENHGPESLSTSTTSGHIVLITGKTGYKMKEEGGQAGCQISLLETQRHNWGSNRRVRSVL